MYADVWGFRRDLQYLGHTHRFDHDQVYRQGCMEEGCQRVLFFDLVSDNKPPQVATTEGEEQHYTNIGFPLPTRPDRWRRSPWEYWLYYAVDATFEKEHLRGTLYERCSSKK